MAPANADLTDWSLRGERRILIKRQRYLLIAPEIGKLGWPALNKTRLTRFGTDLSPSATSIYVAGSTWKVSEISFNEKLETLTRWNVRFRLETSGQQFDLLMMFSLDDLQLIEIKEIERRHRSSKFESDLSTNSKRLSMQLRRVLSEPFKYKANGRGVSAKEFCEGLSRSLKLTLKSHGGRPYLCLENR